MSQDNFYTPDPNRPSEGERANYSAGEQHQNHPDGQQTRRYNFGTNETPGQADASAERPQEQQEQQEQANYQGQSTYGYQQGAQYQSPYQQRPYQQGSQPLPGGVSGQYQPSQQFAQPGAAAKRRSSRPGWGALITTGVIAAMVGGIGAVGITQLTSSSLGSSVATQAPVTQAKNTKATDWETVAKKVTPAVVAIQVSDGQSAADGSGVIFDSAGHILTNHHVIASAAKGGRIAITTASGEIFEAEVVGTDPTTDLAVLRPIDPPKNLQMAKLGDSSSLTVGSPVAAIGNPLGYSSTMTTGVISALDRPVSVQQESSGFQRGEQVVTNAIQVDAAVNPGNSGGPLFNSSGEVIGINSSIASLSDGAGESTGSIGLGFAIPIDLAKQVASQLLENGKVRHAYIGVMVTNGSARVDGTIRAGAKIAEVIKGEAASKADVKAGDVVVAVDGKSVSSGNSLIGYVRRYAPGDKVKLTLVRDSQKKDVEVTLGSQDATQR